MSNKNVSPDFGFDVAEIAVVKDVRKPWDYMCLIMAPKYK